MDSKASPLQNNSSAMFFDPKLLFSRQFSKGDIPAPSPTQLPSPAGSSSSTSSILRTKHRYCLTNGKGEGDDQPWLSLSVSSRSPKSKFLPLFIGKDSIPGIVELELAKPETVREVKVTVCVVFPICITTDSPPSSSRARQLT
jgi:hypothetical protein